MRSLPAARDAAPTEFGRHASKEVSRCWVRQPAGGAGRVRAAPKRGCGSWNRPIVDHMFGTSLEILVCILPILDTVPLLRSRNEATPVVWRSAVDGAQSLGRALRAAAEAALARRTRSVRRAEGSWDVCGATGAGPGGPGCARELHDRSCPLVVHPLTPRRRPSTPLSHTATAIDR